MNTVQNAQKDQSPSLIEFCNQSSLFVFPIILAIAQNTPWRKGTAISAMCISALLLSNFYQTRKFVVDGKVNYADVARFTMAVAWTGMLHFSYWLSSPPSLLQRCNLLAANDPLRPDFCKLIH